DAALVGIEGGTVTIGYHPSAGASMQIIQKEEYNRVVVEACAAVSGRPVRLRVVTLAAGSTARTAGQLRRQREETTDLHFREEVLSNPAVQEALSVLGGEIREVRRRGPVSEPDGTPG
ncbi:MAG TPA: hypothetical protein VGC81_05635, partial [Candidatus Methylomirabilis sp.]